MKQENKVQKGLKISQVGGCVRVSRSESKVVVKAFSVVDTMSRCYNKGFLNNGS